MKGRHYINNEWIEGGQTSSSLSSFSSLNPATDEIVWQGTAAGENEVNAAVMAAKKAAIAWAEFSLENRINYLLKFQTIIQKKSAELSETVSKEIGKPLWEAESEVGAIINKVPISIDAYHERCKEMNSQTPHGMSKVRHKPIGAVAVFGPFNFPAHLPSGHIIPALLAGNTIIFKPSELAPGVAEKLVECWAEAQLPHGVLNLVQGGGETGQRLANHPDIDGLYFTGSYKTGLKLSERFAKTPEKILALEMGGNNPLIVHQISKNISTAVYHTIQSAYITAGQRCTCARRLIVTRGPKGEAFVEKLINCTERLKIGPYTDRPEPFLGPVVSKKAAENIILQYEKLLKQGGTVLVNMQNRPKHSAFLSPGLLDVTAIHDREDEEIFGPLLQLIWVDDFEAALEEANNTRYGLAAGLLCEDEQKYEQFFTKIRAGVVSWNRPVTGASSHAPFGGMGRSGNHRPSAFYAADYCAYPVASLEERQLTRPQVLLPGVSLFDD